MSKILKGEDYLLLIRECGKDADADKVLLAREFKYSAESKSDSVDTLDGAIQTSGTKETSATFTTAMSVKDTLAEEIDNGLGKIPYEFWMINSKHEGENGDKGKFRSRYMQGYFNKFEHKAEAGDTVEYEAEISEAGDGAKYGYATIPTKLKEVAKAFGYKFHDTTKADKANDGLAVSAKPKETTTSTVVSSGSTGTEHSG